MEGRFIFPSKWAPCGPLTLGFGLVREPNGDWRIDELYELGWKPPGLQK